MLEDLFPRAHRHYSALPVLGPIADGYGRWLMGQGYRWRCVRLYVRTLARLDQLLRRRGCGALGDLTREGLRAARPTHSQEDRNLAAVLTTVERYLDARRQLAPPAPEPPSRSQAQVASYRGFLTEVRGLAPSTVQQHLRTATRFLQQVRYETEPAALARLTTSELEAFVKSLSDTLCRASLQHGVAHLRGFLRFLASRGLVRPGLDRHVDTPRHCRQEQLPRVLPWETVEAFLESIDRGNPMGLRDHALFFLMSHHGLRACDLVALTLDDLRWRQGELHLTQRKTGCPLLLPLTDAVGDVLVGYLRQGRPQAPHRQLFLRLRAPQGPLRPTAVGDALGHWWQRSGLAAPVPSPHWLRHSYAAHLLRQGVSLKVIGDLLGHRHPESTAGYLRVAREELRGVALEVPHGAPGRAEVTP